MPVDQVAADRRVWLFCPVLNVSMSHLVCVRDWHVQVDLDSCLPVAIGVLPLLVEPRGALFQCHIFVGAGVLRVAHSSRAGVPHLVRAYLQLC